MTTIPCNCAPLCRQSAFAVGGLIIECNGIRLGEKKLWLGGRTPMITIARSLASSPGSWVSSDALVEAIYGDDPEGGPLSAHDTMRSSIKRLRSKLEQANIPLVILGQHSKGYRLVMRSENAEAA